MPAPNPSRSNGATSPTPLPDPRYRYSDSTREFQWWNNGIGGINKCFSKNDFENGASTLVALEEIRSGVIPIDPRGVWALGQIGASMTWGQGMTGDIRRPNSLEINADDILDGPTIAARGSDAEPRETRHALLRSLQ
ncbi:MAG: hypothetical protein U0903_05105 [Planctomycetales bacterium]